MTQATILQDLGEVPICIAIDKSGSTYGKTLREEIGAVEEICSLLSPRNENPLQLLPWCDSAEKPINLPKENSKMKNLHSQGGTNPAVLYTSQAAVEALSNCGLWFLLTDGQIDDTLVQNFAVTMAQLGLHGIACVIIVFGSTVSSPPGDCDVSVGLAAYAVAPDCLFLFQDVDTRRLLIMQAKGCFKSLLRKSGSPGAAQPILNEYTTWAELQNISYADLSRIQLAPPRKIASDELALQDGLVIRMQDLYAGKVDDERVGELIRNEDNLKSLVISEMARGTGKDLQKWLESQQEIIPTDLIRDRPDIDGKAQAAVIELLRGLEGNETEVVLDPVRTSLRRAHRDNFRSFIGETVNSAERKHSLGMASTQVLLPVGRRRTSLGSFGKSFKPPSRPQSHAVPQTPDAIVSDPEGYMKLTSALTFTFLPGFRRREVKGSEYCGKCMLCNWHAVLVLLMKSPPEMTTTNFPQSGSFSTLAFPLAMSSFAETDVVSFFLCCDSCALYLVKNCTSPLNEIITGALALTSMKENQEVWLDVIDVALKGRFRRADLSSLFIAILDRKILENQTLPPRANPSDGVLYGNALLWAKTELAKLAVVPLSLSLSFRRSPEKGVRGLVRRESIYTIISDRTLIDPGDARNIEIAMLRYPVPGFMVLIRLMRDQGTAPEQIQTHLFQRMMYYVTEAYYANLESNGNLSMVQSLRDLLQPNTIEGLPDSSSQGQKPGLVMSVLVDSLLQHKLIDLNTLAVFRTMSGFEHVEQQTGPATAVYLQFLSAKGPAYGSAIDLFNAFKVHPSFRKVILNPFAIGEGLAGDLIIQT